MFDHETISNDRSNKQKIVVIENELYGLVPVQQVQHYLCTEAQNVIRNDC